MESPLCDLFHIIGIYTFAKPDQTIIKYPGKEIRIMRRKCSMHYS